MLEARDAQLRPQHSKTWSGLCALARDQHAARCSCASVSQPLTAGRASCCHLLGLCTSTQDTERPSLTCRHTCSQPGVCHRQLIHLGYRILQLCSHFLQSPESRLQLPGSLQQSTAPGSLLNPAPWGLLWPSPTGTESWTLLASTSQMGQVLRGF